MVFSNGNHLQWSDALKFYSNQDIIIRFGDDGDYTDPVGAESGIQTAPNNVYRDETAGVAPLCGELTIHTTDLTGVGAGNGGASSGTAIAEEGYYNLIITMFNDPDLTRYGTRAACLKISPKPAAGVPINNQCTYPQMGAGDNLNQLPNDAWNQNEVSLYAAQVNTFVNQAYTSVLKSTTFSLTPQMLSYGWGGAGIWYNKLAEWNGSLMDATRMIPTVSRMPVVMEKLQGQKAGHDNTADFCKQYQASQSFDQAPTSHRCG